MSRQKGTVSNSDLIAGSCGLLLVLAGANGIHNALYQTSNTWDWKISIGLITFGGMIMGVAVNRASNSSTNTKSATVTRKPAGRKSKKA